MCGCLNKTTSTTSRSSRKSSSKRTTSKSSSFKVVNEPVCNHKYKEVRSLGVKIVLLLRKYKDTMLTEANNQVLSWLRNLEVACPDEYEFNVLTQFIDEYTEHKT